MAKIARSDSKPSLFKRISLALRVYKNAGTWQPQGLDDLDRWMDATLVGQDPAALTFTAYFSGVMQISQTMASVSFPLLKREGDKKRRPWVEHPVFNILNRMANPWVNSFKWRETSQQQCINHGNSFSFIRRDNAGRPFQLYLLEPGKMKMEIKDSGEPVYIYTKKDRKEKRFDYTEIFHFAGFGPDPYTGYSVIRLHRAAIGLGVQQQSFSNNFIANGVQTSGVATHPKTLSDTAKDHLDTTLNEKYAGVSNAGRILVFEEGMTFTAMSMSLIDAEFLAGRVFQIQEVARILNMPPHKLKDLLNATFSNIEHEQIGWITDTIRPWAERWESAVNTQLLTPIEQGKGFVEHDLRQLQRGDMKSTMEALRIGRFAGLLNADEAREQLGMNPIEDEEIGQRYWQPVNMGDASSDLAAGIVQEPAEETEEEETIEPEEEPRQIPGPPMGGSEDAKA